jgi:hypothetical protein
MHINKNKLDKYFFLFLCFFLTIFYFYKLYLEVFVPPTGDELNAILVYTSNLKTLFVKNYPNNVTLFHLIGYFKTIILGYDIISYRSINFIFVLLHIWIVRKIGFNYFQILLFTSFILITTFAVQNGLYIGYTFSSFIFCLIFFLIKEIDKKNVSYDKIIFFLLFIQFYNHLVNLYLIIPLLIIIFFSISKKRFLRNFIIYFYIPALAFYLFSILLTGVALLKIQQTDLSFVIEFFLNNFSEIFITGFEGIFFYKKYATAEKFNIILFIINLYQFDKIILSIFILSFIISILSLNNYKTSYVHLIILLHFITIIIINKDPSPRVFGGFTAFYLLIIFEYFRNIKINIIPDYFITKYIFLLILFYLLLNFNYYERISKSIYSENIFYQADKLSKNILHKNCRLHNYNFTEKEKKSFYYNYLSICDKKFSLSEFLAFYRSK